eukprot:PhF_6_TR18843/c0_g1_i1/m.27414
MNNNDTSTASPPPEEVLHGAIELRTASEASVDAFPPEPMRKALPMSNGLDVVPLEDLSEGDGEKDAIPDSASEKSPKARKPSTIPPQEEKKGGCCRCCIVS